MPHTEKADSVIWTLNSSGCFSAKSALEALISSAPEVGWYHLAWHKRHVSRWSLIQWVTILGRLNTRDRLMDWGIVHASSCVLCLGGVESHAHLFFSCQFSTRVWLGVRARLGSFTHDWSLASEVSWGSHSCKNKSVWASLFKLCLAASIYYIWRERNGRIFQRIEHDSGSVMFQILEEVEACSSSWRNVPKTVDNLNISMDWGIPGSILFVEMFFFSLGVARVVLCSLGSFCILLQGFFPVCLGGVPCKIAWFQKKFPCNLEYWVCCFCLFFRL